MSPERPKARVVFDCVVFLQGAARRGSPAAACLLLAELGVVELCVFTEVLSEIRDTEKLIIYGPDGKPLKVVTVKAESIEE